MNTLSILIYLAEVIPNLVSFSVVGSIMYVIGIHLYEMFRQMWAGDVYSFTPKAIRAKKEKAQGDGFKFHKKATIFAVVTCAIATLVPSRDTIHLIAGSEAAEYAVNTEYGKEIFKDIQDAIKFQIGKVNK